MVRRRRKNDCAGMCRFQRGGRWITSLTWEKKHHSKFLRHARLPLQIQEKNVFAHSPTENAPTNDAQKNLAQPSCLPGLVLSLAIAPNIRATSRERLPPFTPLIHGNCSLALRARIELIEYCVGKGSYSIFAYGHRFVQLTELCTRV